MNKVSSFVLLLCISSIASSLKLENICSHDTFKYNDQPVNTFYRVRQSFTFHPIGHYMLNESIVCNRTEFQNDKNFHTVLPKIKET